MLRDVEAGPSMSGRWVDWMLGADLIHTQGTGQYLSFSPDPDGITGAWSVSLANAQPYCDVIATERVAQNQSSIGPSDLNNAASIGHLGPIPRHSTVT